jgi:hypothetical protein
MTDRIKTIVVNAVVIGLICLLFFFAGTWWRMHDQFELGETALRSGDFTGAVAGYESAIHMYIPFNSTIEIAAQQLWKIGESNERLGDINRALIAYRALRSAFCADRWLVTPVMEWIARCDKKITALIPLQKER